MSHESRESSERRGRPETWALAAYLLFVLSLALVIYLGVRPGGTWPVLAFRIGPDLAALGALVIGLVGGIYSLLRRPFLQPRRLRPFLCLMLVFGAASYPIPYPSSHEGHPSSVEFHLPAAGEWTVFWGGDSRNSNRMAALLPDRRWGLHLVVSLDGKSSQGSGLELEDYYAYGREVLAPAPGRVVRVREGLEDWAPGSPWVDRELPLGNLVVIEVAAGQYLFLTQLGRGSIEVKEGDQVQRGQVVGRVGASGFSPITPQPHIAVHLQDTPDPLRGEPIPWRFVNYSADGTVVPSGLPRGGIGARGELLGQRVVALED